MPRTATSRFTAILCTWLVPFCLLFCGALRASAERSSCHRASQSHCSKQVSQAQCTTSPYDIPKAVSVVAALSPDSEVSPPVLHRERAAQVLPRLILDRSILHRVLRI